MLAASVDLEVRKGELVVAERGESPEARTVKAARQGDRAAFGRLHERFAPMAHGIALLRVPASDANDVVQDAFLLALDRLHLLRDDNAFGPWLASIVRNSSIEFHRRKRIRSTEPLPESMSIPKSGSKQALANDGQEQAMRLLRVIRELPETYAETLILRLVEGLTGPQIAACTGMTHGSVRVNLTRGMHMLRARLKEMNFVLEDSP